MVESLTQTESMSYNWFVYKKNLRSYTAEWLSFVVFLCKTIKIQQKPKQTIQQMDESLTQSMSSNWFVYKKQIGALNLRS